MATFVLVPGAWLGGWAWERVTPELRAAGHAVYTPTLAGLGERADQGMPETNLDTHIADVVAVIEGEDLRDVVLVGHSYAGCVVTGVADRVADRLMLVVYLDSAPLEDGESFLGVYPPDLQAETRRQVAEEGEGWRLPPMPFATMPDAPTLDGLTAEDRALLSARATPQPFGTYTQPIRLEHQGEGNYRRAVIACHDFRMLVATGMPRFQVFTPPLWERRDLDTGHWPMFSAPRALAEALGDLAGGRGA
jgi:pimeloyl-ACP methyl ester carboxylesterase